MSIIVKSGVPGKVPTAAQLEYGQLALNYADQKIYFKNNSNQVVTYPGTNVQKPLLDTSTNRIINPEGAVYSTNTLTVNGAITITLPGFTGNMVSLQVRVFNYSTHGSFTLFLHGYTFAGTGTWINTSVNLVNDSIGLRNLQVRFGKNTSNNPVIYIGETSNSWTYPQVQVLDATSGASFASTLLSETGWSVTFATTLDTVQVTHDVTLQKFGNIGIANGGRNMLVLLPTTSNTTNWYRLCTLSLSNASCYVRFLVHVSGSHTTYEVTLSNGAGGDNCLLEVKLRGNYSYWDRLPADWRLVLASTNQPTHVDIRFPYMSTTQATIVVHVLEQWTQVAGQITYPGTNLGTTETNPWYGMRMSSASAITYGMVKIRSGNYQREAFPGFAITTGTITNQTVVT